MITPKPQSFSERIYRALLRLYPASYRCQYEEQMAQLFRDQYREAFLAHGRFGVIGLWMRVSGDLFKSLAVQHLASVRNKGAAASLGELCDAVSFSKLFLVAFFACTTGAVVITFFQPKIYCALARLELGRNGDDAFLMQTAFERIKSEPLLSQVIVSLDLNQKYGKRLGLPNALTTEEVYQELVRQIELSQIRNTGMLDIRVYAPEPSEAAHIANAIARQFLTETSESGRTGGLLLDQAFPSQRPVRPKRMLNILVGDMLGATVALLLGIGVKVLAFLLKRNASPKLHC